MNRKEALKFCALIELEYPRTYRDLSDQEREAVVKNWQTTFSQVEFIVMQIAFDNFRRRSKFPPKTADMIDELREINGWAWEQTLFWDTKEDEDLQRKCRFLMAQTNCFTDRYRNGVSAYLLNSIPQSLLDRHDPVPQLIEGKES